MCIEKEEIKEINSKLNKILFHFESDSKLAHKGIPERLANVEDALQRQEYDRKILVGKQIAYGSIGGIFAFLLGLLGRYIVTRLF